jgi:hypothetical protein
MHNMVGYDFDEDEDMEGDMMGDMMGRAARALPSGRAMRLPPKPKWRRHQVAPGVHAPSQGLVPLTMTPSANGGVFNAANLLINWIGRPQKPFRGERLLATVALTGGAAGQVQSTAMFVGTDLQQASIGNTDLSIFSPTAFGVRLVMQAAQPGIDITINAAFVGVIGAGTAVTSITILGRYIF